MKKLLALLFFVIVTPTFAQVDNEGVGEFLGDAINTGDDIVTSVGRFFGLSGRCGEEETREQCQARRMSEKSLRKQKRVLEKRGYQIDPSQAEIQAVTTQLQAMVNQNQCDFNQKANVRRGKPLVYYDGVIKNNLDFMQENYSAECLSSFMTAYLAIKFRHSDPIEHSHCKKNTCELVEEHQNIFRSNYQGLLSSLYGEESQDLICSLEEGDNFYNKSPELKGLLDQVKEAVSCRDLEVGDVRVVDDPETTGITMNYAMKRLSPKNLQATLVINYTPDENTSMRAEDRFQQSAECLARASTYFRSAEGETINVTS